MNKKRILLKITGELFLDQKTHSIATTLVLPILEQIKQLHATHQFGIVIGGGNLFRGNDHGKRIGVTPAVGHNIGMLASMINALLFKDLCEQHGLAASHFCAIPSPEIGKQISHQAINNALQEHHILIFSGGTGNPFFTNDTNAVLRGLQINASEIWKGTNVDGIYDKDPSRYPDAKLLKHISYEYALQEKLGIMDLTAFSLAQQYKQCLRIFNIHSKNALIHAAQDKQFGSKISQDPA